MEKHTQTLSQLFDNIYTDFKKLLDNDDQITSLTKSNDQLTRTIKGLEELTIKISTVDMFSKNENYQELEPNHLKFLLLPYMLGSLWQLSRTEKRKDVCEISHAYFKDFLKRCAAYELIQEPELGQGEEKAIIATKLNSDAKRQHKIKKFKENKELEAKISAYKNYASKFTGEDADAAPLKDIYVAIIRRAVNDAEDQLESIHMETMLIQFREKSSDDDTAPTATSSTTSARKPLKPFIITKDATQKAVYGVGYPSLPVMTVEELYEQRRETGEWGPPPSGAQVQNPEEDADADQIRNELLRELDDEQEIARLRHFDEYKDDHRRGWGNRFNRS